MGTIIDNQELFKAILELKEQHVEYIKISYSGGGDSGDIDDTFCYNKDANELYDDLDQWSNYNENLIDCAVPAIIIDYVYSKLVSYDMEDWWNNDGGYGIMVIRLKDLKYKINTNINILNVVEYNHNGEIDLNM